MRRVLLIGPGGSGKSTLATQVADRLGLPLVHLDALFWQSGWKQMPDEQWQRTVAELLRGDAWVIDGNFGGTLDLRLAACDAVVLLDLSPALCLWRVIRRRMRFHRRVRADMGGGCEERLDLDFLLWILFYRWRNRPGVLHKLSVAAACGKRVFVLDSRRAAERFITQLPGG